MQKSQRNHVQITRNMNRKKKMAYNTVIKRKIIAMKEGKHTH